MLGWYTFRFLCDFKHFRMNRLLELEIRMNTDYHFSNKCLTEISIIVALSQGYEAHVIQYLYCNYWPQVSSC